MTYFSYPARQSFPIYQPAHMPQSSTNHDQTGSGSQVAQSPDDERSRTPTRHSAYIPRKYTPYRPGYHSLLSSSSQTLPCLESRTTTPSAPSRWDTPVSPIEEPLQYDFSATQQTLDSRKPSPVTTSYLDRQATPVWFTRQDRPSLPSRASSSFYMQSSADWSSTQAFRSSTPRRPSYTSLISSAPNQHSYQDLRCVAEEPPVDLPAPRKSKKPKVSKQSTGTVKSVGTERSVCTEKSGDTERSIGTEKSTSYTMVNPIDERKTPQSRPVDITSLAVLLSIWGSLTLACSLSLLCTVGADGSIATEKAKEVILFTLFGSLPGTILNETLIDRCWRRIACAALGDTTHKTPDTELADRIRAANFRLGNTIHRLYYRRYSWIEFRALTSMAILRWGTAAAIASVQVSVQFGASHTVNDVAVTRHRWAFVIPAAIHALSLILAFALWRIAPWKLVSGQFDDVAFLEKYHQYLERVYAGSIASSEEVARYLETQDRNNGQHAISIVTLTRAHTPGRQVGAKLRGVWSSVLLAEAPPALLFWYFLKTNDNFTTMTARALIQFAFLAQNILCLSSLRFIGWNLGMESLCKTPFSRPHEHIRHLYSASGTSLLVKALKQLRRLRPLNITGFLWFFWVQAFLLRSLVIFFIGFSSMQQWAIVGPDSPSPADGADGNQVEVIWRLWLIWVWVTPIITLPPVIVWLFSSSQAPVCEQDGWRWANIAQTALFQAGNYGVKRDRAVYGLDVMSFHEWGSRPLL